MAGKLYKGLTLLCQSDLISVAPFLCECHENKMHYHHQQSPQLRLYGIKALSQHRPINNLHSSERKWMWGRNWNLVRNDPYLHGHVILLENQVHSWQIKRHYCSRQDDESWNGLQQSQVLLQPAKQVVRSLLSCILWIKKKLITGWGLLWAIIFSIVKRVTWMVSGELGQVFLDLKLAGCEIWASKAKITAGKACSAANSWGYIHDTSMKCNYLYIPERQLQITKNQ